MFLLQLKREKTAWSLLCSIAFRGKNFYRSHEDFFLTVDQNNFGNKTPIIISSLYTQYAQRFNVAFECSFE